MIFLFNNIDIAFIEDSGGVYNTVSSVKILFNNYLRVIENLLLFIFSSNYLFVFEMLLNVYYHL